MDTLKRTLAMNVAVGLAGAFAASVRRLLIPTAKATAAMNRFGIALREYQKRR